MIRNSRFVIRDSKSSPSGEVILVDKPRGWTSHDVVQHYRNKLGIKKIGHTGTLDPLATGLLILLVGSATKDQQQFQKFDKVYQVEGLLGFASDTYDIEGKVSLTNPGGSYSRTPGVDAVNQALHRFRGPITQKVPPFSAVKVKGKKLYQHARKGTINQVNIPERKVEIYDLKLLDTVKRLPRNLKGSVPRTFKVQQTSAPTTPGVRNHEPPGLTPPTEPPGLSFLKSSINLPPSILKAPQTFITLQVHCSSGTYIRSIVHDLGQQLGCGAVVTALRRTRIGDYRIEDAVTIPG